MMCQCELVLLLKISLSKAAGPAWLCGFTTPLVLALSGTAHQLAFPYYSGISFRKFEGLGEKVHSGIY